MAPPLPISETGPRGSQAEAKHEEMGQLKSDGGKHRQLKRPESRGFAEFARTSRFISSESAHIGMTRGLSRTDCDRSLEAPCAATARCSALTVMTVSCCSALSYLSTARDGGLVRSDLICHGGRWQAGKGLFSTCIEERKSKHIHRGRSNISVIGCHSMVLPDNEALCHDIAVRRGAEVALFTTNGEHQNRTGLDSLWACCSRSTTLPGMYSTER